MAGIKKVLRMCYYVAMALAALGLLAPSTPGQSCVDCATGCSQTTVSYQYDNLLCSCPTGSQCVDSGGVCTKCAPGGKAYCYDTLNGCGGLFQNSTSSSCGCASTCLG